MHGTRPVDLTGESPPLPAPTTTRVLPPRAARGRARSSASASVPATAANSRQSSVFSTRARSLPIHDQVVREPRNRRNDHGHANTGAHTGAVSAPQRGAASVRGKRPREPGPVDGLDIDVARGTPRKRRRAAAPVAVNEDTFLGESQASAATPVRRMNAVDSPLTTAPSTQADGATATRAGINRTGPHDGPYPRDIHSFAEMFDNACRRNRSVPVAGPSELSSVPESAATVSKQTSPSHTPGPSEPPDLSPRRPAQRADIAEGSASSSTITSMERRLQITPERTTADHPPPTSPTDVSRRHGITSMPTLTSPQASRLPLSLPILERRSLPASPPQAPTPAPTEPEPLHTYTCPICFCPPSNATLTPCGHILCGECLLTAVSSAVIRTGVGGLGARCPVCRANLPGWDGRGGGVIGLKPRVMISL